MIKKLLFSIIFFTILIPVFGCDLGSKTVLQPDWSDIQSSFSDFDTTVPLAGTPLYLDVMEGLKGNGRLLKVLLGEQDLEKWARAFNLKSSNFRAVQRDQFLEWSESNEWQLSENTTILREAITTIPSKFNKDYPWLVTIFIETTPNGEKILFLACKQPFD